jgi:hypothetical protein
VEGESPEPVDDEPISVASVWMVVRVESVDEIRDRND